MFGDATGTGQPDLYITMNFGDPQADLFFVNLGDATFDELGTARGIADFDVGSHGAAFADMDNDGDYDLVNGATGAGAPNNIFQNDGQGFFTDATPASMAARAEATRGMVTFDMDGDGSNEILVIKSYLDRGASMALFKSTGDGLARIAQSAPIGRANRWLNIVGAADFDGDGKKEISAVITPHTAAP